ncbi:Vba1 protein [Saccharomycopsis crataegensis]|uniref:Vba1 protein n=1 Tax=Saccharomycopsis crataegensis TaxID=43959 RepID=A0AAV5QE52_9ASCO|nr:Vba1 protein [Saccharomycopsis crataegensis]
MAREEEEQALGSGLSTDYGSISQEQSSVQEHSFQKLSNTKFAIILSCLFINVFLAALDSTVVATLLSVIASDLDCLPSISWVATSYLLSCAAFQPIFGKFSDIFGRKQVTLFCVLIFGLGCLCSGISNSLSLMVFGRLISGIGGGGFNTMGAIILSDIVSLDQRGLYQGYINIFYGVGSGLGGVFAGFFQKYFDWRMAFLSQVPVCVISGVLTYLYLEIHADHHKINGKTYTEKIKSIDFHGSVVLIGSIFLLMLAASVGGKDIAFDSIGFVLLIIFGVLGLLHFYFYELSIEDPVIPVKLLSIPTVFSSSIACWVLSMNTFSILLYLPFFWEAVHDRSSYESGIRLIPGAVAASVGSIFAGVYIKIFKKYKMLLIVCSLINLCGSILIYCSSINGNSLFYEMTILVPCQFGMASVVTIILIAMVSSVSNTEHALVTSIQYGFRSTGSTLGVSLASAILQKSLHDNMMNNFKYVKENPQLVEKVIRKALINVNYAHTSAPEFAKSLIIAAYNSACHDVFKFVVLTGTLVAGSSLFINENELS